MPNVHRYRRFLREILVALAILGGWACVTYAIAQLTVREVWPLSVGVLLLSVAGWKFVIALALRGLYVLTEDGKRNA